MTLETAHAWAAGLVNGDLTSVELTRRYLDRIATLNPGLNALISITGERALAEAAASDERRAASKTLSRLDGIPYVLKDNICAKGTRTTCASRMLENFVSPYDATVTRKLADAGAVLLGKANLDEFAMGSSTEFSAFGPSRNPWDTARVPGGSSGGSVVAVAAGMAPLSLGSDTGGSIRQPSGFCNTVGLKPTYGRVSRYGLVAFASSLDQIGPVAMDVEDAALMLNVIAGHDPMDSTSSTQAPPDFTQGMREGSLKGLRVGRPVEFFEVDGFDPGVKQVCEGVLQSLAREGAEIIDVRMPHAEQYAISTYYVLATAEASSNLARYDGAHYGFRAKGAKDIVEMFSESRAQGFGDEVKRRIMLGTFVLSAETFDAYYLRAQKARTLIKGDYDKALAQCDVIIAPTSPTPPFKFGDNLADPVQMYLADIFTLSLNLAGYCGISLPAGFSDGLPVGIQLFAGAFEESKLLRAAWQLERVLGVVGTRKPSLAGV